VITESVRRATSSDSDDVRRLVALERADLTAERDGVLWAQIDVPAPDDQGFLAALSDPWSAVFIAELDSLPFGVAAVTRRALPDGALLAVIDHLFVEAGARELGLGESLLAAATQWATDAGCIGIQATALPGAREAKNLFERAGLKARTIVVYRGLDRGGDPR
jgi:GNAT superfamily N-acetyltransferase